jgi:GntR family transcriptional regulator
MAEQIALDLRKQIESGQLPRGAQLPTELELCEKYAASRNTIRRAIHTLFNLSLVETRAGRGTFVTRLINPLISSIELQAGDEAAYSAGVHSQRRRTTVSVPVVQVQDASRSLIGELSLHEGAQVISRSQQVYVEDVAWILQTAFYPLDLLTRGAHSLIRAEHVSEGTFAYISDTLGIVARTWRAQMVARPPDDKETRFFELASGDGVAIVDIRRIYYDRVGSPFCVVASAYPADRNLFQVTAGEVPDQII